MCEICDEYVANEELVKIKTKEIKIGNLSGGLSLALWMNKGKLNCDLVDLGNNVISEFYVPIKYCPFCGVSLKEVKES